MGWNKRQVTKDKITNTRLSTQGWSFSVIYCEYWYRIVIMYFFFLHRSCLCIFSNALNFTKHQLHCRTVAMWPILRAKDLLPWQGWGAKALGLFLQKRGSQKTNISACLSSCSTFWPVHTFSSWLLQTSEQVQHFFAFEMWCTALSSQLLSHVDAFPCQLLHRKESDDTSAHL